MVTSLSSSSVVAKKSVVVLATTLLLLSLVPHPVPARPLYESIPGVRLLREVASEAAWAVGQLVEGTWSGLSRSSAAIRDKCLDELSCPPKDADTGRNVSEIIRSRGFLAEEYDVVTRDGYILTIQRIVNPLVSEDWRPKMRPVIMQHGLMSSSVDWVINSRTVRPTPYPAATVASRAGEQVDEQRVTTSRASSTNEVLEESQDSPNSLGFYLANRGYDVFLANSRGNLYGQRHVNLSSWQPKFWSFTFDEQIAYDLPDTIGFIQRLTKQQKVGYVGHSQGTTMIFGLLADRPEYADIVEPVVALAPVAYVNNSISPVKYFAVYTPVFQHINWWFATSNLVVKYLGPIVCGPKVIRKDICENIMFLSVGFDEEELDDERVSSYLSHMPSGTSVKNVAHYGQEVLSGRFAHFDHGVIGNQIRYGSPKAPDYKLANIRSNSIVLFHAENDWLASPKDVARLKRELMVEPYASYNISSDKPKWNHIDYVYGKSAGRLINPRIYAALEHFSRAASDAE